jgi:hypothetical protein
MPPSRRLRSARDAAERLLLLVSVCAVASDASIRPSIRSWLKTEGLWPSASPGERRFLAAAKSSRKEQIKFSWMAEAVYVLGWALGLAPALLPPTRQAPPAGRILDRIPAPGDPVAPFLARVRLRPALAIQAAAQRLHDAHWSCRHAASHGRPEPHGYDIEVVQERHRAANWLIGHDPDWDRVSTDT